jgi:anti-sigma factor RsiW
MIMLCDLFNQYRDGMLAPEQMNQFESHIEECIRCRHRLMLLDNLVGVIRNQEMRALNDSPRAIAARAYEKSKSWDVLLLSWLKPLPAWSMAALLVIVSSLWVASLIQRPVPGSNYEDLMTSADQAGRNAAGISDAELENWLEQGGAVQ